MLYLKQALRSLQKNKLFSIFNIVGFAIGFAVCIVIALFAYRESTVNTFFPDPKNTYRLMDAEKGDVHFDHAIVATLKERFPEIQEMAPVGYIYSKELKENLKVGDRYVVFKEMMSTTNDFFKLTGIEILASAASEPFVDKQSVILSKSVAMKLFGHYDIVGMPVHFFARDFVVSAVADDIPSNATFGAEVYLSDAFTEMGFLQNCNSRDDCYLIRELFFSVKDGTDIALLTEKMNADFPENRTNIAKVSLQPVTSIYFSTPTEFSSDKVGNKKMLWMFITIAALTLCMSVFNYVNYTISKQLKTLKQMGIRMAAGAGTKQILRYYLVEVGLSVFSAFVLAVIFANMAMPLAERLLEAELNMQWLLTPALLTTFSVLLVLVVVLSAWFPVSLILRTDIKALLGKSPVRGRAGSLSHIMSVAQLTISIVLLASLLMINKQLDFVKSGNYGFQTEQLLRVELPYEFKNKVVAKEAFSKLPFIEGATLTSHSPGSGWSRSSAQNEEGQEVLINTMNVDADFVNVFQMQLLQGRNGEESDINKGILITETTLKQLGWDDFQGRKLFNLNVLGVVNELQYNSMHTLIGPVAFIYTDGYYSTLNVRLLPGNFSDQLVEMKKTWSRLNIEQPFQFQFYDEYYNLLYRKEDREAKALVVFSVIAFIITCLGLLAQIMQVTERRVKEIGIRKINGASIGEVVKMLNREFFITVVASFLIATPIAYYVMSRWLQGFAYKTGLSWWIFAASGVIALIITLFTVSWQSWRAASRNPVEALRYE